MTSELKQVWTPNQALCAKILKGILEVYGTQAVTPEMMQADIIDYYADALDEHDAETRDRALEGMWPSLLELVDEFRSGASEYDVHGADAWESHKAATYTECADKLRDAIRTLKGSK